MEKFKELKFFEKNGAIKMQIGKDIFGLDNSERKRIHKCFVEALETTELAPTKVNGTLMMYDTGLIAVNINIGKLDLAGTRFLLMVYSMPPKSSQYGVDNFLVTRDALVKYIEMLS